MQLRFHSLFSGSTGNSTLCAFDDTYLLLDAGRTGKALEMAMLEEGVPAQRLSAILITHEHVDHIRGAGVLARKYGLPIYASEGTWAALEGKVGDVPLRLRCAFSPDQDFYIGRVNVSPFSIPHDAAQPCGYNLCCGGKKVSFATDLGHTTKEIIARIADADILLLEANHDEDMLRHGPYPQALKRRILGRNGHLSNAACADALQKILDVRRPEVYLGHLSQENNVPELAFSTVANRLSEIGVHVGRDIRIHMTYPDRAALPLVL